jgi:MoaA/NifB/PqqE/SkfB family radical SAM enzyme
MIPKRILHAEGQPTPLNAIRLPKTVYLHLTRCCNMRCAYCYMDARARKHYELSTNKIKHILNEIADLRIPRVVFTGGEPFLRKDMLKLAQYFKGIAPASAMLCANTNGAFINASNVLPITELFDEIRISIDGFERQNDLLRGQGSYRCAINAIEELLKAGVSPSINITLTALNRDGIELFIRYMLHEWGVRTVRVNPVKPLGRGKLETRLLLGDGEMPAAFGDEICLSTDCAQGWACVGDTLSITPEGPAYPCHWLCGQEFYLGNARYESIGSICARMYHLRNTLLNVNQ